jgi:hypothetical protein
MKEEEENKMSIKKIPLKGLLEILTDLYEEGVNYVDFSSGEGSDLKDILKIDIQPEYMASEEELDQEEEDDDDDDDDNEGEDYKETIRNLAGKSSEIKVTKLSEDDLNNLL